MHRGMRKIAALCRAAALAAGVLPVVVASLAAGRAVAQTAEIVDGEVSYERRTLLHDRDDNRFLIRRGARLELRSCTVTSFDTTGAAQSAIYNDGGELYASNCVFSCLFTSNGWGAAYSDRPGAKATFIDCTFADNTAVEGGALGVFGSEVLCRNCTFIGNHSTSKIDDEIGSGGSAIYALDDAELHLAGCTVVSNTLDSACRCGSGIVLYGTSFQMDASLVEGNAPGNDGCEIIRLPEPEGSELKQEDMRFWIRDSVIRGQYKRGWISEDAFLRPAGLPVYGANEVCTGARMMKTIAGVTHVYVKPTGIARDTRYTLSYPELMYDQLGEYSIGYCGAIRGNRLQSLICATPPNGTCKVPAGIYEPAMVPAGYDGISIVAEEGAVPRIDAERLGRCLSIYATNVVVSGFQFMNGCADGDDGGGVFADSCELNATVIDSEVSDCTATRGGGLANIARMQGVLVEDCSAEGGGAFFNCWDLSGCVFKENSAVGEREDDRGLGGAGLLIPVSRANALLLPPTRIVDTVFQSNTATSSGGALCVMDASGYIVYDIVSNCTFLANQSDWRGGAVYGMGTMIYDSTFARNVAITGGGTYYCEGATRCLYQENRAVKHPGFDLSYAGCGGGSAVDASLQSCLLVRNEAEVTGGAFYGTSPFWGASTQQLLNCTLVENRINGDTTEAGAGGVDGIAYDTIFFRSVPGSNVSQYDSIVTSDDIFYDKGVGNYHLSLTRNMKDLCGSSSRATLMLSRGTLDYEHVPLANSIDGAVYYYMGCYAYSPVPTSDYAVNGSGDSYPDTNLRISLREAVEAMAADPQKFGKMSNACEVKFADSLFDVDGAATLVFGKQGIVVSTFTNFPLVIRTPENRRITISGEGSYRPFYVAANNTLQLEGVTVANGFGSPIGASPYVPGSDGGAIINHGLVTATNCAFRGCMSGCHPSARDKLPNGFGGAIWTGSGATTIVARCSFDGCRAVRGGAAYTAQDGYCLFLDSTFTHNETIRAMSVYSPNGGAYCQTASGCSAAFVNCTLAGNETEGMGGAVYATGAGSIGFLNSIIAGNVGSGKLDDIWAESATLANTAFGVTNVASKIVCSECAGDIAPVDVFAHVDADGMPVAESAESESDGYRIQHTIVALNEDSSLLDGAYAWSDAFGENIGYGASNIQPRSVFRGTLVKARRGELAKVDQLGTTWNPPRKGAVLLTEPGSRDDPSHPEEFDPLLVTAENPLSKAIWYALTYPQLAKDGCAVIRFDPSLAAAPVVLSETIMVPANSQVSIVVEGNSAQLDCRSGRAFTLAEGASLTLRNLSICQGSAPMDDGFSIGGGIYADIGSTLSCSNVVFDSCIAANCGGGVAIVGDTSSAEFTDCTFRSCVAGDWGGGVYRETWDVEFTRCRFVNNSADENPDVDFAFDAKFEHPDGSVDFFDRLSDARSAAEEWLAEQGVRGEVIVDAATGTVTVRMVEIVPPVIDADSLVDFSDQSVVRVIPSNRRAGVQYGLGWSVDVNGPYKVESWTTADADANLPEPLTAPRKGPKCFYRVFAK